MNQGHDHVPRNVSLPSLLHMTLWMKLGLFIATFATCRMRVRVDFVFFCFFGRSDWLCDLKKLFSKLGRHRLTCSPYAEVTSVVC